MILHIPNKKLSMVVKYQWIKNRPWEFAECLYDEFVMLQCRVLDLERELIDLKIKSHLKDQPPKQHKLTQSIPKMVDTSCQTWDQSAMDIEFQVNPPRRLIRCTSFKKKIFSTKVYIKKHIKREDMEFGKKIRVHHHKSEQKV